MKADAIHQLMGRFRRIADGRKFTNEALMNALNEHHLAHDPVCLATIAKWRHDTIPRGGRLLGVIEFVESNRGFLHQKSSVPSKNQKTKRKPK